MAQPVIQTSFASGEWAPKLRSRVDVQKYHAGAALLRNFFVDYSGGGASTRQGTRFIAQVGASGARLIAFQASTTVSYVLEFGQNYLRFYTNGAQVISGGVPYQITTPYATIDLFPNQSTGNPGLKFVQDANALIICHPNYPPAILTLVSATNWTYNTINFGSTISAPTNVNATSNIGAGTFNYAYVVTSVDNNGQESASSIPATLASLLWIGTTQGTNTVTWTAASGAASYNVYKANPVDASAVASGAQYGFVGNVTGTTFTDTFPGVSSDFSQTPPILQNPFSGASIQSVNVTAGGSYSPGTSLSVTIAPPSSGVQATAVPLLTTGSITGIAAGGGGYNVGDHIAFTGNVLATVTTTGFGGAVTGVSLTFGGSNPSGAPSNPLNQISTSGGGSGAKINTGNWSVSSIGIVNDGEGYTSVPGVTFSSGAATATAVLGPASAGNPGVPGFFQERLMLAAQTKAVQGYNLSQPGSFFNYNISNPSAPDDAISGTIISEELNDIRSLIPVPSGIIALTGKGAWTINGGGGISTLNPITPANQSASPQAFNGANDLKPQKINFDVIYGTNKGSYFRDLTYNIYANIFTGTDITTLSNHLFFNHFFLDIAWAEEPFKTVWAVREDGIMLSLAFVKEQELIGWAHHDTNGQFKSVCSVIETVGNGNVVDAVYVVVERLINGAFVQYVERMADRYFSYGKEDSWSVDCGLQTAPIALGSQFPSTAFPQGNILGASTTITFSGQTTFNSGNIGQVIRASGGIYTITAVNATNNLTVIINRAATTINSYTSIPFGDPNWTLWTPTAVVSGLTQLAGQQVVGVADGIVVGPLTVSGDGSVTIPQTATKITIGLAFTPQLKTLPLDLGEPTIQSKRKKLPAVTLRVADTLGLQVGTSFANCVTMKDFQLNAIPSTTTGVVKVTDLVNPSAVEFEEQDIPQIDGRQVLDQLWQVPGQICIQQNLPYPATILGVIPEITPGDTAK